jgi:NAD(P)-dependent dehydrogenase (short-subunit alcohol dehydrogenase family)
LVAPSSILTTPPHSTIRLPLSAKTPHAAVAFIHCPKLNLHGCHAKGLAKKSELLKVIPLGRFGNPSEVAHAVTFLAENQYANNCILNLDGGLSAV